MNTQNASLELIGACYRRQAFAEAEAMADDLVSSRPGDANLLVALGRLAMQHRCDAEALRRFDEALTLRPNEAALHVLRGHALVRLGRWPEAIGSLDRASVLAPGSEELAVAVAQAFVDMGRNDEALRVLLKLRGHKPGLGRYTKLFLARLLSEAKRFDEAGAIYDEVVAAAPTDVQAILGYASFLAVRKREEEAERLLREALAREPSSERLRGMLARLFEQQGRHEEAAEQFRAILALRPGDVLAKWKLVQALAALGRLDEARAEYEVLRRQYPEILERIGREGVPGQPRPHPDAVIALPTPEAEFAHGWDTRLQRCDWTDYERNLDLVRGIIERMDLPGDPAASSGISPFLTLKWPLDGARRLAVAKNYSRHIRDELDRRGAILPQVSRPQTVGRLRIGYVSAEFRNHPGGGLMRSLFACHDRSRVEVYAYALHRGDDSENYRKLRADADHFVHLEDLSDTQAAERIRADGIHVLIDESGHTQFSRPGIFARRPAPVQAGWLGFPGTTGADCIDYIVADPVVLPEPLWPYFTETPVLLPECYQVNDRWQTIDETPVSRADEGLPAEGFVFCGFNAGYKIEPGVFDCWMRILKRVPGSALWFYTDKPAMKDNLRREAEDRGVDPARLIFAERRDKPLHLARFGLADLLLDTFICGAHTTASDALWAGVPVLTCPGEGFASRVGASLLTAVGLPELICASRDEYVERAVALATTDRPTLEGLRKRLQSNRLTEPLFDTERFARHMEDAFAAMWAAYEQGKKPAVIHVPARPRS